MAGCVVSGEVFHRMATPSLSRMPDQGEGVLHRKRWLKSLMSRKQIVNKVIHVSITLCPLGPFYHTYEQSPEKF